MTFNPNDIGQNNGNIFGLPLDYKGSELIILPVPWDVTVSYRDGTHLAPNIIVEESLQVDLYDLDYGNFWEQGICLEAISDEIGDLNETTRPKAVKIIEALESGVDIASNPNLSALLLDINKACQSMVDWVEQRANRILDDNKKLILLGGDHSTPLGYLKALSSRYSDLGILQIDAHCDLREAYEGFHYSHASIMYNALQLNSVKTLIQVGIRDFCEDELLLAQHHEKTIIPHFDRTMQRRKMEGESWKSIATDIIKDLPQHIYISFDIDGLDPALCPKTGTPVVGGLTLDEVFYLFDIIKKHNKQIVGIDLNEVGNDVWDANVGARVLHRLCGLWMA